MTELEKYYNKFNEDKRLTHRRGMVEFATSMHYIEECLEKLQTGFTETVQNTGLPPAAQAGEAGKGLKPASIKIADIGAGTGRYSIALACAGCQVTAVEYVQHNLGVLKQNARKAGLLTDGAGVESTDTPDTQKEHKGTLTAFKGDARKLKRLPDDSFDLVLLFGPLYHLFGDGEKLKALGEARRIVRPGGYILAAYCMNEYPVLVHGFLDGHIGQSLDGGEIDESFHCRMSESDLYDYVRTEDICRLSEASGLTRVKLISADGPAHYMRPDLNAWTPETFELFMKYHLATCERQDLIGAARHTVDILKK